jgi:hypothetical protein
MTLGSDWVMRGTSAVLRTPSANIPAERNDVLNCAHPDFLQLHIGAAIQFSFDSRMWK